MLGQWEDVRTTDSFDFKHKVKIDKWRDAPKAEERGIFDSKEGSEDEKDKVMSYEEK